MLTQAQKDAINKAIESAETGPSFIPNYGPVDAKEITLDHERQARIWAESWIIGRLRGVLDNDAGRITASELSYLL